MLLNHRRINRKNRCNRSDFPPIVDVNAFLIGHNNEKNKRLCYTVSVDFLNLAIFFCGLSSLQRRGEEPPRGGRTHPRTTRFGLGCTARLCIGGSIGRKRCTMVGGLRRLI